MQQSQALNQTDTYTSQSFKVHDQDWLQSNKLKIHRVFLSNKTIVVYRLSDQIRVS